jgi:hypothetical protein
MLEHADRPLAAAEDCADLAGGEPIHEAENDDLAAVVGELVERAAEATCLLGEAQEAGRIGKRLGLGDDFERGCLVSLPRAERIGQLVVRDPEQPGTERGALVAEAIDGGQRGDERPLSDVLGVVVVAEEVEAVSVDTVDVPAIQRPEGGPVALRGADVGQVGICPASPRELPWPHRHAGTTGRSRVTSPPVTTWRTPPPSSTTRAPVASRSTARPRSVPSTVSTLTAEPSVEHRAR